MLLLCVDFAKMQKLLIHICLTMLRYCVEERGY